ncbi:MAG: FAD:protein FMN transferase [Brumimicrobium sp.]
MNVISRVFLLTFILISCNNQNSNQENQNIESNNSHVDNAWYANAKTLQGTTQGTTFTIKTSDDSLMLSPKEISSLLAEFDNELSGYISNSLLSKFNKSDSVFDISETRFFNKCYLLSQEVYKNTNGAFDPSVFPLVKAWGFFKEMNNPPSQQEIDSILGYTGFKNGLHHIYDHGLLSKNDKRFMIDFNAIAQGQSVDVVAEKLDQKNQENYFIEIGGEIRVKGVNDEGEHWVIGIDTPQESNTGSGKRKLENYLKLSNVSVATSGNYRKFYKKDGKRFSHTINPKTGRPVKHSLLSTTVIAKSAAVADGYATAFMTMGVDKTLKWIKKNDTINLDVYLLFENNEGRIERAYSNGMNEFLIN